MAIRWRSSPGERNFREGRTKPRPSFLIHFSVEHYMRQLSVNASVLAFYLRRAVKNLVTFLGPSWDGPVRKYRPERHYMRGPGPKWREKHFRHHVPSAGGS